jgi:hypothetical protein
LFPGDPEFSYNNFYQLPFEYVVQAYYQAQKIYQKELHANERPIALQSSLIANVNRDSKRQRKPYTAEDFFLYQPRDEQDLPAGRCGAAALALIEQRLFPTWALFCYKELASGASNTPPALLAFISDTAVLLAPVKTERGYKGMLIAQEAAGECWHKFESPCGRVETLYVPKVPTKIMAQDNMDLKRK